METVKTASNPDSIFKSLTLVPAKSNEWKIMWDKLARHKLNRGIDDPFSAENFGETWQYMESHRRVFGFVHLFRHRLHPKSQTQERVMIKSSFGLKIIPNT